MLTSVDEHDSKPKIADHTFFIRELPASFEMAEVYPHETYFPWRNIIVPEGTPFSELPAGGHVSAAVCLRTNT